MTPPPYRHPVVVVRGVVLDVPWTWQVAIENKADDMGDDEEADGSSAAAVLHAADGRALLRLVWLPAAVAPSGRGTAGVHAAALTALRRSALGVLGRGGAVEVLPDGGLFGRRADGDGAVLWVRGFTADRRAAGLLVVRSSPEVGTDLVEAMLRTARRAD